MARDERERSLEEWSNYSNRRSMEKCREMCGLEPVTNKPATCYRCKENFSAQFIGKKQNDHYCARCLYNIGRMNSLGT